MGRGISICIVARNEALNIAGLLSSFLENMKFEFPLEILLIDNRSSDRTVEKFESFFSEFGGFDSKVIKLDKNHLGLARAAGIYNAKHEIVGFIDADCRAPASWLENLQNEMALFDDPFIFAIGGGNLSPPSTSSFYTSLSICLSHYFGNFGTSQAKRFARRSFVSHIPTCNVFYSKSLVLALGNFSEKFGIVCEDLELSLRATNSNFKMVLLPELSVLHYHKERYWGWAKKMFRYGWGQILVARIHPRHLLGIKSAPLLSTFFCFFVLANFPKGFLIIVLVYALAFSIISASLCLRSKRPNLFFSVFLLFFLTHLSYAGGELWGVLNLWRINTEK